MSYVLEDYARAFEQLKRTRNILASTQSVYYTLLGEADLRQFPAEFEMSIRDLGALAGLKSTETVHTAKNVLKNIGLIDFKTLKRTTVFTLLPPNAKRTPTGCLDKRETNICQTPSGGISGDFGTPTHAGTGGISFQVRSSSKISCSSSRAREGGNLDEVLRQWRKMGVGGEEPNAEQAAELTRLLQVHGREWLLYAMRTAAAGNNNTERIPMNFLLSITARLLKGGERVGRQMQGRRTEVNAVATADTEEDSRGKWIFSD